MRNLILIAVAALSLQSCASIFAPSKTASVQVSSNVSDVEVHVNGRSEGIDPTFINVKKKDVVTFSKEGYTTANVSVKKRFNAVSLLNIIAPIPLVGWIVDIATGHITKVSKEVVTGNLIEKK